MKILVTGAKGMVGIALVNNLKNIRDGKNKTRPNIYVEEIYEYDLGDENKFETAQDARRRGSSQSEEPSATFACLLNQAE